MPPRHTCTCTLKSRMRSAWYYAWPRWYVTTLYTAAGRRKETGLAKPVVPEEDGSTVCAGVRVLPLLPVLLLSFFLSFSLLFFSCPPSCSCPSFALFFPPPPSFISSPLRSRDVATEYRHRERTFTIVAVHRLLCFAFRNNACTLHAPIAFCLSPGHGRRGRFHFSRILSHPLRPYPANRPAFSNLSAASRSLTVG